MPVRIEQWGHMGFVRQKSHKKRYFISCYFLLSIILIFGFQNCTGNFSINEISPPSSSSNTTNIESKPTNYIDLLTGEITTLEQYKAASVDSTTIKLPLNLGVHMGGVENNAPKIEEYLFPARDKSAWYLAQWKKIYPLKPSLNFETETADGFLFKLKNPQSTESQVNSFLSKDNGIVYEFQATQGYGTSVGGSNMFLSANIPNSKAANFDKEINFLFDTKVLQMSALVRPDFKEQESDLLQQEVLGFYIGGFPVIYNDGNPENNAVLFIQYYISDTRVKDTSAIFRYRGFYPHGSSMEIVSTLPISDITNDLTDLKMSVDAESAPMSKVKVNLNRLLCQSLSADFNRTDGVKNETLNFAKVKDGLYLKNLKYWSVGSLYLGFETQAVFFNENTNSTDYFYPSTDYRYGAHDVREEIKQQMIEKNELYKGDVSMRVQVANLAFLKNTDPDKSLATCDDVNSSLKICTSGSAKNSDNLSANEWMCDCTSDNKIYAHKGWQPTGNNCFRRTADFFCANGTKTFYTCGTTPTEPGWYKQSDGCYHWKSSATCQ